MDGGRVVGDVRVPPPEPDADKDDCAGEEIDAEVVAFVEAEGALFVEHLEGFLAQSSGEDDADVCAESLGQPGVADEECAAECCEEDAVPDGVREDAGKDGVEEPAKFVPAFPKPAEWEEDEEREDEDSAAPWEALPG